MITVVASLLTSLLAVFFAFKLEAGRIDGVKIQQRIDSKLDIERYERECKVNEARVLNIEQLQVAQIGELTKALQEFGLSLKAQETDIKWIREAIKDRRQ